MRGYLWLADRSLIEGDLHNYSVPAEGEVVFTTGMTGYVESLTDPSYAGQILIFTYPLIGNYGVPKLKYFDKHLVSNFESEKIWVKGVIVSSFTDFPSHHQSKRTFKDWLYSQKIPILSGVDTRHLTKKLREHGVLNGKIVGKKPAITNKFMIPAFDATSVSIKNIIKYKSPYPNNKKICLLDCGVKHGIIRSLLSAGYDVTRLPYDMNPFDSGEKFDAMVCSNGPGDPKDWRKTVENIRLALSKKVPFLGICLGHQLLSLAIGADTYKLKYGHRGLNQPVKDKLNNKCYVTSQNHGYAVRTSSIPKSFSEWFINLNDQTNEGLQNEKMRIFSTQFHPEGIPGPADTSWLFKYL